MLQLKNIVKNYLVGDNTVHALQNVSLSFRKSEFVSILGPSGCGKTTLLNIIGGLDRYTDGDIIINGTSTKDYRDKDWDSYRNHSIGFVFQSYNLIPHQSVLKNVELALTLSGIKREERRLRAKQALEKVGLGDQLNKKPNQMSGGQMQRVAIARAIVNDPDIILADEPTGALDTETSVQVMEILKELAQTKLVIMVTHNPELAKSYSTRIINLQDGNVVGDTMPFEAPDEQPDPLRKKNKKPSMSFWTALSLSFNNLATKKARTILTSFAGSIGIIGIALVLSVSSGFNSYIAQVQQETLTSYPLTISQVNVDMSTMVTTMLGNGEREGEKFPESQTITSQNAINDMITKVAGSATRNDLKSFKAYLDENLDKNLVSAVQYSYPLHFTVYKNQTVWDASEKKDVTSYNQVYPTNLPTLQKLFPDSPQMQVGLAPYYESLGSLFTSQNAWSEMIDNEALIEKQYDLLDGHYPESANELLLVVDQYNQISDLSLYMLGLMTDEDISYIFSKMLYSNSINPQTNEKFTEDEVKALLASQGLSRSKMEYSFSDLLNTEYSIALDTEKFEKGELKSDANLLSGDLAVQTYTARTSDGMQTYLGSTNSDKLKVCGIVRLKDGVTNGAITGSIAYTKKLTEKLIDKNNASDIVKDYLAEATKAPLRAQKDGVDVSAQDANLDNYFFNIFDGSPLTKAEYVQQYNKSSKTPVALNAIDESTPNSISIYPVSFETKDDIIAFIEDYNSENDEAHQIKYNDLIGVMMSSITVIIQAITYVLIAFVSISLIVSSIMIGIITYISVLERTKEIGILRSIGASKNDVKTVFNAETIIVGFVAGVMGIAITLILNIPINLIIGSLSGIMNVAQLPIWGAIGLILISTLLTTIAGLFPASLASKKDPVVALRTE